MIKINCQCGKELKAPDTAADDWTADLPTLDAPTLFESGPADSSRDSKTG